jgi:hypothetical protein
MNKFISVHLLLVFMGLVLTVSNGHAQTVRIGIAHAPVDTTKKDSIIPDPRSLIKPYAQVISPAFSTKSGLFTVHECKDTVYLSE